MYQIYHFELGHSSLNKPLMEILTGRSHQIPGYRCANDLGLFGAKTALTFHFNVTARATKQNLKLSVLISVRLE